MRKLFSFPHLLTLGLLCMAGVANAQQPVVTNPRDTAVCSGVIGKFIVNATNSPTYSWQESANGTDWTTLTNGGLYAGATTDTLSVSATATVNGYWYRAIATNGSGADTSDAAMLTVNPLADAGTISGLNRVCIGNQTTLTSTATGGTWSVSNAHGTINAGGVFTGSGATGGIDTVYYAVTNGCGTSTASYPVWVDAPLLPPAITGPATVCVGSSVSLMDANPGGTWTATNGHATVSGTGMVSGITAGVDTIMHRYGNACGTDSAWTTVTVETPLTPAAITGADTSCVGSLVPFTTTVPGGIWVSSNGAVATADMMGNVTGRGQGTAIISYIQSNSCGSFTATDTLVIERGVSMIVGSDSVGIGGHITLTDSVSGGMWMTADSSVATVGMYSGIVHGIDSGVTTITYMATNFCGTTTATITMYVGEPGLPGTISGPDSVCVGSSITLTPSEAGGVWTASNAAASVTADGLVTGLIGGMWDTLTYTVYHGFGATRVTKRVYINQAPVIVINGPASVAVGNGYTITATPAGGTWVSSRDTAVTFVSSTAFVVLRGGLTNLYYTVSNVCGTSVDTFVIDIPTTEGVSTVNNGGNNISIYPNPNNGTFTLDIAAMGQATANVVVTNTVGAVVKETSVKTGAPTTLSLNQPDGIYFISVITESGKYTRRIVVSNK